MAAVECKWEAGELQTERLLLRPMRDSDAAEMHLIRSQHNVMQWTTSLAETSISQSLSWIQKINSNPDAHNFCIRLLTSIGDIKQGEVIGAIGAHAVPQVGYLLRQDVWGHGFATEALKAYMTIFWTAIPEMIDPNEQRGYNHAIAYADTENHASRRVLEKTGFVQTDTLENDVRIPLLGLRSTAVYRIARPGLAQTSKEVDT
ncbi:MAG: hypothetical protein M1814_006717 [Vezdaea aestivalis]|nr:MAG: hypothetical protein M1814_006717 [Vezdaea aestivalis]